MSDPILDLITDISPRLWVRDRDGEPHDLLHLSDLGLRARTELLKGRDRVEELLTKDPETITEQDDAEFSSRYIRMVEILIPSLKDKVEEKLDQEQREAVVQSFFSNRIVRQLAPRLARMYSSQPEDDPTGEPSSPSSEPSTGEDSTNG